MVSEEFSEGLLERDGGEGLLVQRRPRALKMRRLCMYVQWTKPAVTRCLRYRDPTGKWHYPLFLQSSTFKPPRKQERQNVAHTPFPKPGSQETDVEAK